MNEDFKVELTRKDDSPAYSQSLSTPINLNEDILVELALLHRYGIVTTLLFSKYASPIFAQKNPNGELRLLIDLLKINNLISDDYINNNHPVSTLTDAAQHMAPEKAILQTGPLASISLLTDGRPEVHRNACFQFCHQNLRKPKMSTKTK